MFGDWTVSCTLLGITGDFENDAGDGIQRYGYELYRNLRKCGMPVQKREYRDRLQYSLHMLTDSFDTDVVHIPNFRLFYPLRKGKAATLVTAHDFQPLLMPEIDMRYDATLGNKFWFGLVKAGMRRMLLSDYIICNSTMTRDDAVSLGYDKSRVFVANHGIDDRFRRKAKARAKAGSKGFKVGYLGGFRARKNISFAIESFRKLDGAGFSFELWGKKDFEYRHLEDAARGDARIRFMGFAPEARIVDVYDSFDCFVFPSLYEGEGLEILEAQARGLPVVIYKKARVPQEIRKYCLEAKGTSHMAEIIRKIKTDGYNERLKEGARAYASRFSWQRNARETLEVYKRISA